MCRTVPHALGWMPAVPSVSGAQVPTGDILSTWPDSLTDTLIDLAKQLLWCTPCAGSVQMVAWDFWCSQVSGHCVEMPCIRYSLPLPLLPSKQKKLKSQLTPRNLLWPSSGSIFWDTGVANRELIQVGTEKHVAPDTHMVSVFPSRKNQLARSYSIPMYYFIIYTHIIYSVRTWIRGGAFGEQFKHPQTEPLLLAFSLVCFTSWQE